jgi:protein transport protein SEC61 subunit gamma and related proteins
MVKIKNWLNSQWHQYVRLWRIMKKPSMQEFKMIAKVSAVGVLLLGMIGFLINLVMTLIK